MKSTNKSKKEICTVDKCTNERYEGDLLFCPTCRDKWYRVCRNNKLLEKKIPDVALNRLVKEFQEQSYGMDL